MAQPLPNLNIDVDEFTDTNYAASNGIDASASRLDQAFRRLEAAASRTGTKYASLKAEQEKLNHLLRESEREVAAMRDAVQHVNSRIDHTIATLEALEQ